MRSIGFPLGDPPPLPTPQPSLRAFGDIDQDLRHRRGGPKHQHQAVLDAEQVIVALLRKVGPQFLPSVAARLEVEFDLDPVAVTVGVTHDNVIDRSEEHTSELQSLMRISYAVFCLKKKHTINS